MRTQLCDALLARSADPQMLFVTGDLGFMALEPLETSMGERFINGGVAEQNMMSVAAALSKQRFDVWVYSIAPFCYARPFEQIRNDIAFHNLPVHLIGNGGGYGYGVMGPTHHAIEDYGVLLTLPNFSVFAPVFDEDVSKAVEYAGANAGPTYLRLGRGEHPKDFVPPAYAPWRQLTNGGGPVVLALGPLAGSYMAAFQALPDSDRPNLWAVAQLPVHVSEPPRQLLNQIASTARLIIAEEHVAQGGLASQVALYLAQRENGVPRIVALSARAHHYDLYGSQTYLRRRSSLDVQSMLEAISA